MPIKMSTGWLPGVADLDQGVTSNVVCNEASESLPIHASNSVASCIQDPVTALQ
jgi:hypothetical protein